jgi:hypothetical protein
VKQFLYGDLLVILGSNVGGGLRPATVTTYHNAAGKDLASPNLLSASNDQLTRPCKRFSSVHPLLLGEGVLKKEILLRC